MNARQKTKGRRQKLKALKLGFIMFAALLGSCNSGAKKSAPVNQSDKSGTAKFAFSEEIHNFGALKDGEVVTYTFTFRNTGTKTLTITNVDSGCGCTEVNIPNKEIEPGKEGQIEVVYNSAGEVGKQLKTITLFSNAEQVEMHIFIKANVTNEAIKIYS